MELPLYQKHLIEAIRSGCKIWMDDLGNVTYHIRLKKVIKNVTPQTIETLKYRGLIKESSNTLILTEYGMNGLLTCSGADKKTLYSI